MDTCEALNKLVAEQFKVPMEVLHRAKTLRDAGIDSLATLDLVFAIENRFSIMVSADDMAGVQSLRDLATVVDRLIARKEHCNVEE